MMNTSDKISIVGIIVSAAMAAIAIIVQRKRVDIPKHGNLVNPQATPNDIQAAVLNLIHIVIWANLVFSAVVALGVCAGIASMIRQHNLTYALPAVAVFCIAAAEFAVVLTIRKRLRQTFR